MISIFCRNGSLSLVNFTGPHFIPVGHIMLEFADFRPTARFKSSGHWHWQVLYGNLWGDMIFLVRVIYIYEVGINLCSSYSL